MDEMPPKPVHDGDGGQEGWASSPAQAAARTTALLRAASEPLAESRLARALRAVLPRTEFRLLDWRTFDALVAQRRRWRMRRGGGVSTDET
jgi:hypothetical protein